MPVQSSNQGLLIQFDALSTLNCNRIEKEKIIRELVNTTNKEELIVTLTYHFHLLSQIHNKSNAMS
ncbi:hypothetical protein ACSNKO_18305 [Proteus mirabilis]|uniref:hypothetical protein n=1 Tax=Proteus mirabilis TaxID=584 RepID=UPI0018C58F4D|nr:hypothetical protein [Proteus mirabilis]MBI6255759.1 hypothetical protein [Proteus mirabilis]